MADRGSLRRELGRNLKPGSVGASAVDRMCQPSLDTALPLPSDEGTTQNVSRTVNLKAIPEHGLTCLIHDVFVLWG